MASERCFCARVNGKRRGPVTGLHCIPRVGAAAPPRSRRRPVRLRRTCQPGKAGRAAAPTDGARTFRLRNWGGGGGGPPPPAPPAPKTAAPCGAAVFGVVPCLTAENSSVFVVVVHLSVLEIVEVVVVVLVKIPCIHIVAGVVGIVVRRTGRGMVSLERWFCC